MKPLRESSSEQGRQLRQISIALTIPMVMAAGPLVGFGLAWAAQRWLGAPGWTKFVGIALGTAAGIRQLMQLLKRMQE